MLSSFAGVMEDFRGSYRQSIALNRKGLPTTIRCKGYSGPPYDGCYLGTMDPGTFFGPVEEWVHANQYLTVLVSGWWISVYDERNGTWFADRVVVPV